MNTTVTTMDPVSVSVDAPPVTSIGFHEAKMLVNKETGALHIHNDEGTIASFNEQVWASAVRGSFEITNGRAVRRAGQR